MLIFEGVRIFPLGGCYELEIQGPFSALAPGQRSPHFQLCIAVNFKSLQKKSAPRFDF